MINNWCFSEIWKYFDYNADAIYTYSEQIAKLPEIERKKIYADISRWIQNYFEKNRGTDQELYELVGCIVIDIYRTMNKVTHFTEKQAEYLENTAKVIVQTLKKQGIRVHFGSNNYFEHPSIDQIVELFRYFWSSCGFIFFHTITNEQLSNEAYRAKVRICCKTHEWCALMFPNGGEKEFDPMLCRIGQPGVMTFFKDNDADSSKYRSFPYVPISTATPETIRPPKPKDEKKDALSADEKGKEIRELKARYMNSAGYLIDVLYPAYTELALAEKKMYSSLIAKKTKAQNVLSAFIKLQDRIEEAFKGLPKQPVEETKADSEYCVSVITVNLILEKMVKGRVDVLKEYIQNGISDRAEELNAHARYYCKRFDELMPKLIDETQKREGNWIDK